MSKRHRISTSKQLRKLQPQRSSPSPPIIEYVFEVDLDDREAEQESEAKQESEAYLSNVEALLKVFWEKGYVIIPKMVPTSILKSMMDEVEDLSYESIFKDVYSKVKDANFDAFRYQAPFPKSRAFSALKKFINDHLIKRVSFMRWQPRNWVVLKSIGGGEEQQPHHDFPSFETARARALYDTIQAGLMIGMMEDSKLVIYDSCFGEANQIKRKIVKFGIGDCILFRGDLVHNGAAYDSTNYRIHSTFIVKGIRWDNNATDAAPMKIYKCQFCSLTATTRLEIKNHSRRCDNNPDLTLIIARDKDRNNQVVKCTDCDKAFNKKNSLYRHRKRKHEVKE